MKKIIYEIILYEKRFYSEKNEYLYQFNTNCEYSNRKNLLNSVYNFLKSSEKFLSCSEIRIQIKKQYFLHARI